MADFQYIEGFYNFWRPHSANQMMTSSEIEENFYRNFLCQHYLKN